MKRGSYFNEECTLRTTAAGVNRDCEGLNVPMCEPCTRRKGKQLKDLVDLGEGAKKRTKIFKCDMLTTRPKQKRTCPGKGFGECMFCTKFKGESHALEGLPGVPGVRAAAGVSGE